MKRQIELSEGLEQEGLMYDLDRARAEGLYEEIVLKRHEGSRFDVSVTPELFEALMSALDLSVNLGPDDAQHLRFDLYYKYGYGEEMQGEARDASGSSDAEGDASQAAGSPQA